VKPGFQVHRPSQQVNCPFGPRSRVDGRTVVDPEAIREALRLRRGGTVMPWAWQVGHSWFTLRIEHPRLSGNLHLVCGACDRVEFDARLLDCDLRVEEPGTGCVSG
jgi:hypothetical protein